ncbi:MAG: aminopeptidase P family protein [Caulobacteraceae bacterium]
MIKERISKLRKLMKERGIDAYIIPSFDAHQSEYVPEHWKCRQWISGFTGSAGTVVVTEKEAGLWTDGRYFIQAEKQLEGSGIKLFKIAMPGVPTFIEWIGTSLPSGSTVGFDGRVISVSSFKDMLKTFKSSSFKFETKYDLIGELWADRPAVPNNPVIVHELKYAGKSRTEKLSEVRKEMKDLGASFYLLSSLDDVAWLYNIRGNDVPNTPVVSAYTLISDKDSWLFIDKNKVSGKVEKELTDDGIKVMDYSEVAKLLSGLTENETVLYDPEKTNVWLYKSLKEGIKKIEELNITTKLKAVKSPVEIENLRNCQIKDGAALVKFLCWLDKNLGKEKITEMTVDEKLIEFRAQQEYNMGPSFDTIAGYKEHAAMMHYRAVPESDYTLAREGMLLIDNGGQYLDGTTDITRTIVLGKLTDEQKKDFTLVLKAHIGLATAKFLKGCTCTHLDILSRRHLWKEGLDYRCGTGHGVGFLLSVHEGPQGFRRPPVINTVILEEGMILTNEPGIYKEGMHGVRTENTLLVTKDYENEYGQFMRFDTISYCPIDLDGLNVSLLTQEEKDWLNNYHKEVFEKLSPLLSADERKWLENETRAI